MRRSGQKERKWGVHFVKWVNDDSNLLTFLLYFFGRIRKVGDWVVSVSFHSVDMKPTSDKAKKGRWRVYIYIYMVVAVVGSTVDGGGGRWWAYHVALSPTLLLCLYMLLISLFNHHPIFLLCTIF
ncbi:hypothetical protein LINGRAHAP2_LOCUS4106 [Linum grandiflorum]